MKTIILILLALLLITTPIAAQGRAQSITLASYELGACYTWFLGDIDGDGAVGILDFSLLASAWGARLGDAHYLRAADLDCDGLIGEYDYQILALQYGRVRP